MGACLCEYNGVRLTGIDAQILCRMGQAASNNGCVLCRAAAAPLLLAKQGKVWGGHLCSISS